MKFMVNVLLSRLPFSVSTLVNTSSWISAVPSPWTTRIDLWSTVASSQSGSFARFTSAASASTCFRSSAAHSSPE
jgi:hypothetical protein